MPFAFLTDIVLSMLLLASTLHCQVPDGCEVALHSPQFLLLCPNAASIIRFTRFPNFLGHESQIIAAQIINDDDASISTSGCDPDAELLICLYYFPNCSETGVQPPCREFCDRITTACSTEIDAAQLLLNCSALPAFNEAEPRACYDPDQVFEPTPCYNPVQLTPESCVITNTTVFGQVCSSVSSIIPFTRFPNIHGHSQPCDADAAIQDFTEVAKSTCDIDVQLFVCLYHFPTCRKTSDNVFVVQPPCRDFCLRLETPCAMEFATSAIDCSVLPSFDPVQPTSCYDPYHLIVLNEVNVEGTPFPKFVEFWDFGMNETILDFFTVAFYDEDGNYVQSFNLTGETTKMGGYITIGQSSDIDYNTVDETSVVALYRTNRQEYQKNLNSKIHELLLPQFSKRIKTYFN